MVLGLGDTGMSMARWLNRRGAIVSAADTRAEPPHASAFKRELPQAKLYCGGFDVDALRNAEVIAISPGIDRRLPLLKEAEQHGKSIVGDIELFANHLAIQSKQPRVIAVTGTNGKSTVVTMAGAICTANGFDTVVAGNIGTPVLDVLTEIEDGRSAPDAYVLELSSFQLESTQSLRADAAAVLNVTEDHLDRYDDMNAYAAAKAKIFSGQGTQVLNREDSRTSAMAIKGRTVISFGLDAPRYESEWGVASRDGVAHLMRGNHALMASHEMPLPGLQNAANALAAGALCHAIDIDDGVIASALRVFKGLPHRVEKIAERAGVDFYDDSKGTNVGATVAALNGFDRPVVLIAGGDGKGQDFSPLREPVRHHARHVVLIGRDREKIAAVLDGGGVTMERADDMHDAVRKAVAAARTGDAVLLSPACASLDMYKNYLERAQVFVAAVGELSKP